MNKDVIFSLGDGGLLEGVLRTFEGQAAVWAGHLIPLARVLFSALASVEIAWTFVTVLTRYFGDRGGIGDVFRVFVGKILYLTFLFYVLLQGPELLGLVIKMYSTWGATAGEVSTASMAPSHFLTLGTITSTQILQNTNVVAMLTSPMGPFFPTLAAWFVQAAYAIMAAALFTALIESYILLGAFFAFLSLGACRWTAGLADAVLAHAFRLGAKIFILYLISSIVLEAGTAWADNMRGNYFFGPGDIFGLAGTCLTIAVLFWTAPRLSGALIPPGFRLGLTPRVFDND